jgi:rRNA maturation endonuclease Nob1
LLQSVLPPSALISERIQQLLQEEVSAFHQTAAGEEYLDNASAIANVTVGMSASVTSEKQTRELSPEREANDRDDESNFDDDDDDSISSASSLETGK